METDTGPEEQNVSVQAMLVEPDYDDYIRGIADPNESSSAGELSVDKTEITHSSYTSGIGVEKDFLTAIQLDSVSSVRMISSAYNPVYKLLNGLVAFLIFILIATLSTQKSIIQLVTSISESAGDQGGIIVSIFVLFAVGFATLIILGAILVLITRIFKKNGQTVVISAGGQTYVFKCEGPKEHVQQVVSKIRSARKR